MGVYLSAPIVDKESEDGKCEAFTYGVSSMQGWRMTQEDCHNCLPDFDGSTNTSLFAVYDGHGGAEVAKYCAAKLPGFIREVALYKEGKLGDALTEAMLGFDLTLKEEEVVQELKVLAGVDDDEADEEVDDPMGRTETDMLMAEATMPIEELRAKYGTSPSAIPMLLKNKDQDQSPMLKAKRTPGETGKVQNGENGNDNNATAVSAPVSKLMDKLENGEPDNDNNLNVEKELREAESHSAATGQCKESDTDMDSKVTAAPCDSVDTSVSSSDGSEAKESTGSGTSAESNGKSETCEADSTTSSGEVGKEGTAAARQSGSGDPSSSGVSSCGVGSSGVSAGSSGVQAGGSGECSTSGSTSGAKAKDKKTIVDEVFDSEDDTSEEEEEEEEEEEYLDDSDEDEEEDEEEEEGGSGIFGLRAMSGDDEQHNEEPGSDSGCTAVIALLREKQLVVANVGDSRCVLCRDGKAVDMSEDHKPEDDGERKRIEAAGGKVTNDGRVNGGLNLSRALGDHWYKKNESIPAQEQMISALPDIETTTIGDTDEFVVIACDGIWNFMASQEVVDFVRERLKNEEKRQKPSLICEELFDHCLAPNTMGDGTGCDNMTCIIISLNHPITTKRQLSESEETVQPEKRTKVEEEKVADNSTADIQSFNTT